MNKKFFRCNVCNDIHLGIAGPEICPTCQQKNAYVEIDLEEAKKVMNL
jgi:rubrerythrin